jgi:hypothetical protein
MAFEAHSYSGPIREDGVHTYPAKDKGYEAMSMKIGRNDSCHCGSGAKYKKCCASKDEAERSARLAAESASSQVPSASAVADAKPATPAAPAFRSAPHNRNAQFKPKAAGFKPPSAVHRKSV